MPARGASPIRQFFKHFCNLMIYNRKYGFLWFCIGFFRNIRKCDINMQCFAK